MDKKYLDIMDLKLLARCPMKYKVKQNRDEYGDITKQINETISYTCKLLDEVDSENFELRKYHMYKIWAHSNLNKTWEEIIKSTRKRSRKSDQQTTVGDIPEKIKDGIDNFYERYKEDIEDSNIIEAPKKFKMNLSGYTIVGSIPAITNNGDKNKILMANIDSYRINNDMKDNYIHVNLMAYAYEKYYDKNYELIYFEANEDKEKTFKLSKRKRKSAIADTKNLLTLINNDLFFKSSGRECKGCDYSNSCSKLNY